MCVFYVPYVSPIDLQREIGSWVGTKQRERLSCMCSCSCIVRLTWVATLFLVSNVETKLAFDSQCNAMIGLLRHCSSFWLQSSVLSIEGHLSPNISFSVFLSRSSLKDGPHSLSVSVTHSTNPLLLELFSSLINPKFFFSLMKLKVLFVR